MAFFEGSPVGWGKAQGLGEGGSKGFGSGGVGGRGTGPSKFRNLSIFDVSNAYKKKKNGVFLKDRFRGGRWYGHGLQGRWLQERVGGGVGWMGRVEAWLAVKRVEGKPLHPRASVVGG